MFFLWGTMAAAVLAPIVVQMRAKPTRREIAAGVANGAITAMILPTSIFVLQRSIGAVLVFPITIAGPLIPVLILGHWVYKERHRPHSHQASAVTVAGLVLLCIGARVAEERPKAPPAPAGYRISTIRTAPAGTMSPVSSPSPTPVHQRALGGKLHFLDARDSQSARLPVFIPVMFVMEHGGAGSLVAETRLALVGPVLRRTVFESQPEAHPR